MGERKPGRIVTILGDTRKTKNSVTLARRADVLVHESTFNKHEAKWQKPTSTQPVNKQLKLQRSASKTTYFNAY